MAIWVLLILYVAEREKIAAFCYGRAWKIAAFCYMVWFLFRSLVDVAFRPSVFELSFCFGFLFVSPLVGAFLKWSRWWWPRGIFIFYSALFLVKSILLTSRHEFCFPYWVSSFWWSRSCWPRGTNLFLTVLFFCSGIDLLDPEARIYFLQCTSFGGVDLLDPEAQIYFL